MVLYDISRDTQVKKSLNSITLTHSDIINATKHAEWYTQTFGAGIIFLILAHPVYKM